MKSIKNNLFKLVNVSMVVFSICTMFMNHTGVNVLNADAATSIVNGDKFEYKTSDSSFMFKKNGKLIGSLPTDKKLSIRNDNMLFQSNAAVVSGKVIAAAAAGGLAAAGPAAIAALQEILGAGFAVFTSTLTIPGAAAVEATLAGAGEVAAAAAAADAAIAAGGIGALMSAFVMPALACAGVGALGM